MSHPDTQMFPYPYSPLPCLFYMLLFAHLISPGRCHQHSGKAASTGGDKLAEPTTVKDLLNSEKQFEKNLENVEPGFFKHSAAAQRTLFHTAPGVVFAERNIAAQYYEDDKNGNAVLVYATAHLGVHNIIVMGHYGCGGVAAAVTSTVTSEKDAAKDPIEAWIWPIRYIYLNSKSDSFRAEITALRTKNKELKTISAPALNDTGYKALVEENVKANVQRIHKSKAAMGHKGPKASIYGWVYDIATGDIKDLGVTVSFGK
ncbi:carbonic anhydrase [Pleurotus eryngii]|uniref:Carbonic anhydrase n=1 Tax=Pleurotus eryngii TaxID=5323 RepID=A0A9P6A170_PLEER|nr:carbonic anhydrase [Pleurotus eryngii]